MESMVIIKFNGILSALFRGKHLVNFEYDHFQVVGLNNMFAGEPFQLVA
jgi:hypothetical protein